MHFHLGLKHKQLRREKILSGESDIPSNSHPRYIHFLDKTTLVAGVIGPFTVLPQIYQIFSTHQAGGVSSISWILMFIVTFPWIFYGIAHKDKAIIASFILWEFVNLAVVVGALMYS